MAEAYKDDNELSSSSGDAQRVYGIVCVYIYLFISYLCTCYIIYILFVYRLKVNWPLSLYVSISNEQLESKLTNTNFDATWTFETSSKRGNCRFSMPS